MDKFFLLGKLPVFKNSSLLIRRKQSVYEIIKEVCEAHRFFAKDYNLIAAEFYQKDLETMCRNLWQFCKKNIRYSIEPEESQTTKSPSAILALGVGDCKHYSGFIAGVLDAIQRKTGRRINWKYRFAGYNGNNQAEHVFVVVDYPGGSFWIDPVLDKFNKRLQPSFYTDRKPYINNSMALMRISGPGGGYVKAEKTPGYLVSDILANDEIIYPELYRAIQLLLKHGILDANAKLHKNQLRRFQKYPDLHGRLAAAADLVQNNSIGGFFSTIWRGVKKVTLAAPRAAFLSLVSLNAFGYATKLKAATWNPDGSYTTEKAKIKTIWQDKLGGDWAVLERAIKNGATKRAILGAAPATVPAWVVTAGAVIAAVMPIVNAFLKKQQAAGIGPGPDIDPATGLPYGQDPATTGPKGSGVMNYIKENPLMVAAGAGLIYFLFIKKKRA